MARYKLMCKFPNDEEHEVGGQRKNTKSDMNKWCDNIAACGLDWRVGYAIKLRDSSAIYQWRWIKNNEKVEVG